MTSRRSGWRSAARANADTSPSMFLRGSNCPTYRTYGDVTLKRSRTRASAASRERRGVRAREVAKAQQRPFDVRGRRARERGEKIARVATDAPDASDRLEMTCVERHAHRGNTRHS